MKLGFSSDHINSFFIYMNVQWDMDMESSMALRAILCCVGLSCRLQDTCPIRLSTPITGPTKTHSTDFQDAHQGVAPSPL